MMNDTTIACEKCGARKEGPVSLARHLRDDHSMEHAQAIAQAIKTNAHALSQAERIRRAAPELLRLLIQAQPHVCSLLCPSVWKTGEPEPPHSDLCNEINAAIARARGTDGDNTAHDASIIVNEC